MVAEATIVQATPTSLRTLLAACWRGADEIRLAIGGLELAPRDDQGEAPRYPVLGSPGVNRVELPTSAEAVDEQGRPDTMIELFIAKTS